VRPWRSSPRPSATYTSRPWSRSPEGLRINSTNWRSASVTPVRTPWPKAPSSGRAYSGTSREIVARISSVIASSSGSITSATLGGSPRHGSVFVI
jgi:hypothetical protein